MPRRPTPPRPPFHRGNRDQNERRCRCQNSDVEELVAVLRVGVARAVAGDRPAVRAGCAVDFRPGAGQRKTDVECGAALSDLGRGLCGVRNGFVDGGSGHRHGPLADDRPGTGLKFRFNPSAIFPRPFHTARGKAISALPESAPYCCPAPADQVWPRPS